uniref:Uncharacterized protein n=1 Tax=Seriola lalandi dorsalis TaxID=1841481 RepID=A0A3B4WSA1_SERLL
MHQQVKLVFSEQLSKLQTKQHQDTELLEEIRYWTLWHSMIWICDEILQTVAGREINRTTEMENSSVLSYTCVDVVFPQVLQ